MSEEQKNYIKQFRKMFAYEKLNADSKDLTVALFRIETVGNLLQIAEQQQKIIEELRM